MKTLVYCTVLLWCLFIPLGVVCADDSYEIYDIFHKQKYMIHMHVSLEEEYAKEKIILSLLEQEKVLDNITMVIPNLTGVRKSEILAETFLHFTFSVSAGTGIQMRGTKVIGVKDGKLFVTFDLLTTNNFYAQDLVEEKYEVDLDLKGNTYKNYKLLAKESRYLDDPPRHEQWEEKFTIPFNYEEMIFTNGRQTLNGKFIFVDPYQDTKKERVLKNVKVNKLTLKNQDYLHLENVWYFIEGNRLIK